MENRMLDKGVTGHGQMSRGYDKHGKRVHMATPKRDMSLRDSKVNVARKAGNEKGVDSNTPRSNVGL